MAPAISPAPSLFVTQRPSTYFQGNMGKFWGRLEVGWEKVACWGTKAALSLKRVKIDEKLLWRAYRNSPTLFRTVPPQTLYGLPFPKIGVRNPNSKLQSLYYLRNGQSYGIQIWPLHSKGPSEQKPMNNLGKRECGRIQTLSRFLSTPIISGTGKAIRTSNHVRTFIGSIGTKAH